ncbi:MAG: hypothetical protein MUO23_08720 [Anaerolineales bacterium]|nr:hypothetical protein [Anaerolineales bacterium]
MATLAVADPVDDRPEAGMLVGNDVADAVARRLAGATTRSPVSSDGCMLAPASIT